MDLITSIQENHKKVASLLLDKAKDICAKYGVMVSIVVSNCSFLNYSVCACSYSVL